MGIFFLHQGGKKHLNIFDDEIVLFSTCRRSVAGLLEECYRMWFRWMLKRYDEAFLSLCLYALIFLPRTCVCVYECVAWLLPVKLTCWRSTSTKHFLLLLRRKRKKEILHCCVLDFNLFFSRPLSRVTVLFSSSSPLTIFFLWSVRRRYVALTWLKYYRGDERKPGARLKRSASAGSWRVRHLCDTVATCWAKPCWAVGVGGWRDGGTLHAIWAHLNIRRKAVMCVCMCPLKNNPHWDGRELACLNAPF